MSRKFNRITITALFLVGLSSTVQADHVNWKTDVEASLKEANESGRLVLMKFTADWCGYCKKMERETFTRPGVVQVVNDQFVPVLVDADKHKQLVRHLKIKGLPAILVVSPEMVILNRISGYQTEAKLLPQLQNVLAKHKPEKSPTVVAGSDGFTPNPTRPVSQQTQTAGIPDNPFAANPEPTSKRPAVFDPPAFGGLCLPSVTETRSLVSGTPQFAMKYRGKTLYFRDAAQMEKFQTAPAEYWPMFDGNCSVTKAESGKHIEGKLEYAAKFRGKLWLSSSSQNMKKFVGQPANYAKVVTTR